MSVVGSQILVVLYAAADYVAAVKVSRRLLLFVDGKLVKMLKNAQSVLTKISAMQAGELIESRFEHVSARVVSPVLPVSALVYAREFTPEKQCGQDDSTLFLK